MPEYFDPPNAVRRSRRISDTLADNSASARIGPDEPPGVRPGLCGFSVVPWMRFEVNQR